MHNLHSNIEIAYLLWQCYKYTEYNLKVWHKYKNEFYASKHWQEFMWHRYVKGWVAVAQAV
jgi:hypothetical protein